MPLTKIAPPFGRNAPRSFFLSHSAAERFGGGAIGKNHPRRRQRPPLVLKVLDHLNAHYAQPITLDWLAENFFVSKATLMYNFKKYTGRSPIDFLLSVRLEHAKKMLISTKKSINEIAEACGFSSANYFGLIFKKKENLSPVHYRKHQLNKG